MKKRFFWLRNASGISLRIGLFALIASICFLGFAPFAHSQGSLLAAYGIGSGVVAILFLGLTDLINLALEVEENTRVTRLTVTQLAERLEGSQIKSGSES